jgi:hypothetical protein
MTNLRIKVALIAIAFIALSGAFNQARAYPNCTNKCETGHQACVDWCNAHNKTLHSRLQCIGNCGDYWHNGKNPQSIGPSDPRNSPPSGPAQVNPPPKAQ